MISEGLIWTYLDCANICYLFGEYELPCIFMTLSSSLFALLLFGLILFFMHKIAKEVRNSKPRSKNCK